MRKRKVALPFAAVMLLLMLAACGGSNDEVLFFGNERGGATHTYNETTDNPRLNVERVTHFGDYQLDLTLGAGAISMEVAAEIGADMIESLFGVNLDDKTIYMTYFAADPRWLPDGGWSGSVMPKGGIINETQAMFAFSVNPQTREVVDINFAPSAEAFTAIGKDIVEIFELEQQLGRHDWQNPYHIDPFAVNFTIELSQQYARYGMDIAESLGIFDGNIARGRVMIERNHLDKYLSFTMFNEDMELVPSVNVHVEDENGNCAIISFLMESKQLVGFLGEERLTYGMPTDFDWVYR
ncbi:MAG: hypothetical protein FWC69_01235 [Defluviitaleaceae bacterium]|nr:hypothetical protein [Defluviitaleaceae bacterium]